MAFNRALTDIAEGWHIDMKQKLFYKEGIMLHFKGPGSLNPPRHREFQDRQRPPSKQMIEDFWGKLVWSYMETRIAARLHMRDGRLANAFWCHDLPRCLAVVFADGTKHNQSAPYVQGEHGYW